MYLKEYGLFSPSSERTSERDSFRTIFSLVLSLTIIPIIALLKRIDKMFKAKATTSSSLTTM
jgi:hypothetical protein